MKSTHHHHGFSTLEVLAAIVVLTVMFLASLTVTEFVTKKQFEGEFLSDLILVKSSMINILNNPEAWSRTVSMNPTMSCLITSPYDCSSSTAGSAIDIYDANGDEVYKPSSGANQGLTSRGAKCSEYIAPGSPGKHACPMRLILWWKPICPTSGACISPQVQLNGTFEVNAPYIDSVQISNRLQFSLIK